MCPLEKKLRMTLYTKILNEGSKSTLLSYGKVIRNVLETSTTLKDLYVEPNGITVFNVSNVTDDMKSSSIKSMKTMCKAMLDIITDEIEFTSSFVDQLFQGYLMKLIDLK